MNVRWRGHTMMIRGIISYGLADMVGVVKATKSREMGRGKGENSQSLGKRTNGDNRRALIPQKWWGLIVLAMAMVPTLPQRSHRLVLGYRASKFEKREIWTDRELS